PHRSPGSWRARGLHREWKPYRKYIQSLAWTARAVRLVSAAAPAAASGVGTRRPATSSGPVEHPALQALAPLVRRVGDRVVLEGRTITIHGVGEDPALDRSLRLPVREGHRSGVLERLRGVVPLVPVVVLLVEGESDEVLLRVEMRRKGVPRALQARHRTTVGLHQDVVEAVRRLLEQGHVTVAVRVVDEQPIRAAQGPQEAGELA